MATTHSTTMAAPALGGVELDLWGSLTRRIAFSLGLVIGIAILGALAFTERNDVRVLWYDEAGRLTIGILRTETQERLDRAAGKLAEAQEQLRRERETAHHRLHQAEQEVQRARAQAAQQTKALELAHQRMATLQKQLAHAGAEQQENAVAGEGPQLEQLKERLKSGLKRIR